jgi:hypothetical protein
MAPDAVVVVLGLRALCDTKEARKEEKRKISTPQVEDLFLTDPTLYDPQCIARNPLSFVHSSPPSTGEIGLEEIFSL